MKRKTVSKRPRVPCSHWPKCEGCPLIATPYLEQLKHKRRKVYDAFRAAGFSPDELNRLLKNTRSSPLTLGYRNKAKWILERHGSRIRMGMYRPGTHEVIDMPHCAVHAPAINEVSSFIRESLERNEVPCGPLNGKEAILRYLIVRYSFREKKLLVVFVTSASNVEGLGIVIKTLSEDPIWSTKVVAIVQNINADPGNVLLGEANRYYKKSAELTESMGPFRVPVGPLSFLQVNSLQASYLYKRVKELMGPGPFESGLDLYSGVGLIAMHLSKTTKRILAVEEVGPAALEAITATRRNKIQNILELCADSIEGIQTFNNEWGAPEWIVLNPPRKGCEEHVLASIMAKPPGRLVYVSCNPATLARDIVMLINGHPDFVLKIIEPVDMFPQTEHIECIVLLENRNFRRSMPKASGKGRRSKGDRPASTALH